MGISLHVSVGRVCSFSTVKTCAGTYTYICNVEFHSSRSSPTASAELRRKGNGWLLYHHYNMDLIECLHRCYSESFHEKRSCVVTAWRAPWCKTFRAHRTGPLTFCYQGAALSSTAIELDACRHRIFRTSRRAFCSRAVEGSSSRFPLCQWWGFRRWWSFSV